MTAAAERLARVLAFEKELTAMRVTDDLIEAEQRTVERLRVARGWAVWLSNSTTERNPARPPFLAVHDGNMHAVWTRPRPLRGSDTQPATTLAPSGAVCVVWWPKVRRDVHRWVNHPTVLRPPGWFAGTWPGTDWPDPPPNRVDPCALALALARPRTRENEAP